MPSWVIIGASRGIGYQYLRTLSRTPTNTIIGLVRETAPTISKIQADGLTNVHILTADLTSPASLSAAAEQTAAITNGIVDYLIVNGGYVAAESYFLKPSDYATQHDIFLDEFILCMRTNAAGLLYSVNAFLPLVKKSEIKKVVYMTSAHAAAEYMEAAGISMGVPYAMSKAAANVLVTKLAIESKEKGDGVVFLSLSPGMVFTLAETWEELSPEYKAALEEVARQARKYEPRVKGWERPGDSVDLQLNVIQNATLEDSGRFLSHTGTGRWLSEGVAMGKLSEGETEAEN